MESMTISDVKFWTHYVTPTIVAVGICAMLIWMEHKSSDPTDPPAY